VQVRSPGLTRSHGNLDTRISHFVGQLNFITPTLNSLCRLPQLLSFDSLSPTPNTLIPTLYSDSFSLFDSKNSRFVRQLGFCYFNLQISSPSQQRKVTTLFLQLQPRSYCITILLPLASTLFSDSTQHLQLSMDRQWTGRLCPTLDASSSSVHFENYYNLAPTTRPASDEVTCLESSRQHFADVK
jgi:hypothetical protein